MYFAEAMMSPAISLVPDDCMFAVFDRLPLKDLLSSVNLVCREWSDHLYPEACRRRRTLLLLQSSSEEQEPEPEPEPGPESKDRAESVPEQNENRVEEEKEAQVVTYDAINLYDDVRNENGEQLFESRLPASNHIVRHVLVVREMTTQVAARLMNLFPRIRTLHIEQLNVSVMALSPVLALLFHWFSTIVELRLSVSVEIFDDDEDFYYDYDFENPDDNEEEEIVVNVDEKKEAEAKAEDDRAKFQILPDNPLDVDQEESPMKKAKYETVYQEEDKENYQAMLPVDEYFADEPFDDIDYQEESVALCRYFFTNLLTVINKFTSVRHLDLLLKSPVPLPADARAVIADLSILGQLSSFRLSTEGLLSTFEHDVNVPLASVQTFSLANERLVEIDPTNPLELAPLLQLARTQMPDGRADGRRVARTFRTVNLADRLVSHHVPMVNEFCGAFSALSILVLRLNKIPWELVINSLAQLSQLLNLHLSLNTNDRYEDCLILPPSNQQLPQLSSVQVLTLQITTKSHEDLDRLSLPTILPALQLLELRRFSPECPACHYNLMEVMIHEQLFETADKMEVTEQELACLTAPVVRLLRQCARLHTVWANLKPLRSANDSMGKFTFTAGQNV